MEESFGFPKFSYFPKVFPISQKIDRISQQSFQFSKNISNFPKNRSNFPSIFPIYQQYFQFSDNIFNFPKRFPIFQKSFQFSKNLSNFPNCPILDIKYPKKLEIFGKWKKNFPENFFSNYSIFHFVALLARTVGVVLLLCLYANFFDSRFNILFNSGRVYVALVSSSSTYLHLLRNWCFHVSIFIEI